MKREYLGQVTHFYGKICVAVLSLSKSIAIGDVVRVRGRTTDFEQPVRSLQIEHQPVDTAGPGEDVALEVLKRVRRGDKVYRLLAED